MRHIAANAMSLPFTDMRKRVEEMDKEIRANVKQKQDALKAYLSGAAEAKYNPIDGTPENIVAYTAMLLKHTTKEEIREDREWRQVVADRKRWGTYKVARKIKPTPTYVRILNFECSDAGIFLLMMISQVLFSIIHACQMTFRDFKDHLMDPSGHTKLFLPPSLPHAAFLTLHLNVCPPQIAEVKETLPQVQEIKEGSG